MRARLRRARLRPAARTARGSMNRRAPQRYLQLPRNLKPVLAQSVGHLRA
jgi:hypothetical protein